MVTLIAALYAVQALNRLSNGTVYQATEDYSGSGHADKESPAFTHWDNDVPPVISSMCAKCHSTAGFLEFLGEDGSRPGSVFQDVSVGNVITCSVCHNLSAHTIDQVIFHSGAQFNPFGSEATCLTCHQTRQSGIGLQLALVRLDSDLISPELNFISPHYNFAASTQLGGLAGSGFEYPDREYAGYFAHAYGAETCTDCHNKHSLQVDPQLCSACHTNVVDYQDFGAIRVQTADYDGDSDTQEGIRAEIEGLQQLLLNAMREYAVEITTTPIIWGDQFPYFFIDVNNNGIIDAAEMNFANQYNAWTPRLIRAAYNFQFSKKDPGGYVHNSRYVLQLLHDSIYDLADSSGIPILDLPRP
jgi:hypothetical protein